jgi:hypothetical protein
MTDIKYPNIEVELSESNGNAYAIIGTVRKTLRRAGVTGDQIQKFTDDAMSGDYDHVLQTCMKWVNVT